MRERLLHALLWRWEDVEKNLPNIKYNGFTGVQISPITECKPIWDDNGRIKPLTEEWWEVVDREWANLYQPLSNRIGNHLGTKEDFISLCRKADEYGIKIIPDLVMRHTANTFKGGDEELVPCHLVDKRILDNPHWFADRINISNEHDRWQVTHRCTHLPMLHYEMKEVQDYWLELTYEIAKYTPHYRLDQAKHFMLREEGGTFLDNVLRPFGEGVHYGECILQEDYISRKYWEQHGILPLVQDYQLFGDKHRVAFFESHDTHRSFLSSLMYENDELRMKSWEDIVQNANMTLYYARRNDKIVFSDRMREANKM